MKCCNSIGNAETQHLMHQGSRVIIIVVHVRGVKNICNSSGGAQEKGKTG
jgi:hypothetical protein